MITMIRRRRTSSRIHVPVCAAIISGLVTSVVPLAVIGSEGVPRDLAREAEIGHLLKPSGAESAPGDCDNSGIVDLTDFAGFALAAQGPDCGGSANCRCYDLNGDDCVDLRDFAAFQVAFGTAQGSSGPPPSNMFVLQLADYHNRCTTGDGGDGACHVGDPCCQTQAGPPETPCDVLQDLWIRDCDTNGDGQRDRSGTLDTLAEWNDFFWEPDDACNLLAREQYPNEPTDSPYTRHFIPMCTDGSTPPKGTTVCPDGQPIIQCTDGTRPAFYYYPATKQTDRWIIKIQGGGTSCSAGGLSDCWVDAQRDHFSSAWSRNGSSKAFQGIFAATASPLADYHRVVIDKCVGDRNQGSSTIPLQEFFDDGGAPKGQGPVYFHGYRESQALLAYLTLWDQSDKLNAGSQISILTQSNGSNGLYMYLDRLAEFIRHDPADGQPGIGLTGADVRGLASAYVRGSVEVENLVNDPSQNIFAWSDYPPAAFDDHITAPLSTTAAALADGLWYSPLTYYDGNEFRLSRAWGTFVSDTELPTSVDEIVGVATLDESCFAAHGLNGGGGGNVEACLDSMHVLMNHVTTPVFLAPQLYDFKLRKTALQSYTRLTESFLDVGYLPDAGSVCGSHDENFVCADPSQCPDGASPCDPRYALTPEYDPIDFAQRVRAITRGAADRSTGTPEESPADVGAPVGHAVFAPEWNTHSGWADMEKMDYRMCDDADAEDCAWRSAPLWVALRAWLELDATVICVEQDDPGIDPDRPLTPWSETTPGPLLDDRCGLAPE